MNIRHDNTGMSKIGINEVSPTAHQLSLLSAEKCLSASETKLNPL